MTGIVTAVGTLIGLVAGVVAYMAAPAPEADPYTTPSRYAMWWWEVRECVGRDGDLRDVAFYVVESGDDGAIPCPAGRCFGYYSPREHAIYMSDTYLTDRVRVKHEMVHALGVYGHPPEYATCAEGAW